MTRRIWILALALVLHGVVVDLGPATDAEAAGPLLSALDWNACGGNSCLRGNELYLDTYLRVHADPSR